MMKFFFTCLCLLLLNIQSCLGQRNGIRFADDFENGFNPPFEDNEVYDRWYTSGWSDGDGLELSCVRSNNNIIGVDDPPVARSGKYCLKAVMQRNTDGNSRSEIGINLRQSLGEDWYGFSIYVPSNLDLSRIQPNRNRDWMAVLAQWGVWANNPGLPDFALRMSANQFIVTYEPGRQVPITLWSGPIIQGQWVDWVFRIKWSKSASNDGSGGALQIWQNGVEVYERSNFQTTDGDGSEVKTKIGLYFSSWGNNPSDYNQISVYYDDYTIAVGPDQYRNAAPGDQSTSTSTPTTAICPSNPAPINVRFIQPSSSTSTTPAVLEEGYSNLIVSVHVATASSTSVTGLQLYLDGSLISAVQGPPPYVFLSQNIPNLLGLLPGKNHVLMAIAFDVCGSTGRAEVNLRVESKDQQQQQLRGTGSYTSRNGLVSIEAENGATDGIHDDVWSIGTSALASGSEYLQVIPTNAASTNCRFNDRCTVSYKFSVTSTDNYNFWYRAYTDDNAFTTETFYWRILGSDWQEVSYTTRGGRGRWYQSSGKVVVLAQDMDYTLQIAQGPSDGTKLDKFVLQRVGLSDPTGNGPAETLLETPVKQARQQEPKPQLLLNAMYLEAEDALVIESPMRIGIDSKASNGEYVLTPPGQRSTSRVPNSGKLSFQVALQAGTYRIWARVVAPSPSSDSYYVQIDADGPIYNWNKIKNFGNNNKWGWDVVRNDNADQNPIVDFELEEGKHTITFYRREDGVQLDRIYVTSLGDEPSDTNDNTVNAVATRSNNNNNNNNHGYNYLRAGSFP